MKPLQLLLIHALILCASGVYASVPATSAIHPKRGFEENIGQISDEFSNPNRQLLYIYKGQDFDVYLKHNSFSYCFRQFSGLPGINPVNSIRTVTPSTFSEKLHRIDISFQGATAYPHLTTSGTIKAIFNYYSKSGEALRVAQFERITQNEIYPGISMEYVAGENFKYNIIVNPGADLSRFKMRVAGAGTSVNKDGVLEIQTAFGLVEERIPISYLTENGIKTQEVNVRFYEIEPGLIGLQSENYNSTKQLVIDPVPWATYFGGSAYENGSNISTDSFGNILVAGYSYSSQGIATVGAYQTIQGGNNDGFVLKMNSEGALIWATYFGGGDNDYCYDVHEAANGKIGVVGFTGSTSGIASAGAFQQSLNGLGTTDAFIACFNASGQRLWSTYLGGSMNDYGYGITSDLNSNFLICGYTNSNNGISTSMAHQINLSGGNDAFFSKFSSEGDLIWSTYFGGTGNEYCNSISSDRSGNIVAVGFTNSSTGIATPGAHQVALGGTTLNMDAFVIKLNAKGNVLWSTYLGGEGYDEGRSIAVDYMDNIYIAGTTRSTVGIATTGAFLTNLIGETDVYLVKFDSSGQRRWGTYFGGFDQDYSGGIDIDYNSNVCLVGFTSSYNNIASPGATRSSLQGNMDAFLAKFDSSGNRNWSSYYGGGGEDYANGVVIGQSNMIVVTGLTNSSNGISTPSAYQNGLSGSNDAFIVSFSPNGNLYTVTNNSITGAASVCPGSRPNQIQGSMPSGGNGQFQYLWLMSSTGAAGSFIPAPGINNSQNYQPPLLSYSSQFRRLVFSGGETDTSNMVSILIYSKPNPNFSINSGVQCTNNNLFVFNDLSPVSDSISKRYWKTGSASIDSVSGGRIERIFDVSGNINIQLLTVNKFGCRDSVIRQVILQPSPIAVAYASDLTTFCSGDSVKINTAFVQGYQYEWIINGTQSGDNQTFIYSSKTDTISVIQTNNFGCKDTSEAVYTYMNPKPEVFFDHDGPLSFCKGGSVTFKAVNTGFPYYQWQIGNFNLLGENLSELTVSNTGRYRLIARSSAGCFDTSSYLQVTEFPKPAKPQIVGKSMVKRLETFEYSVPYNPGSSYTWSILNGTGSGNTSSTFVTWNTTGKGIIKVVERSIEGCFSDTGYIEVTIDKADGITEVENTRVDIYPVPANNFIQIDLGKVNNYEVSLFSLSGNQLINQSFSGQNCRIETENLSSGIYLISIHSEGSILGQKYISIIR